jgi:hypothetical protein
LQFTELISEGVFWVTEAFKHYQQGLQSTLNSLLFAVGASLSLNQRGECALPRLRLLIWAKERAPVIMVGLSDCHLNL